MEGPLQRIPYDFNPGIVSEIPRSAADHKTFGHGKGCLPVVAGLGARAGYVRRGARGVRGVVARNGRRGSRLSD